MTLIEVTTPAHTPSDGAVVLRESRVRTVLGHVVLGGLGLLCIVPVYWLYATSLRAPEDIYSLRPFPWPLSVASYAEARDTVDLPQLLLNTFVMAALIALGQLVTGLLAGYAFAAWRFRLQNTLYLVFVATWLVPFQVTMVPNYALLNQLGTLNTITGVVIPNLCSALAVIMLRSHLRSIPHELLEAARMDGRGAWSTLWTVVVPNLWPALAALGVLLFINAWNEYFWPALVLQRTNNVLQLALHSFIGPEGTQWGPLMATAGLACLPVLLLYLILQRRIVDGFVRSGLK
ncbi:carbohydrate ABC transporter permease [Pseudonocardia kujensis]|uniref:carbohydrate ABC transporter permease n=1 Tax=Pseudonocardia kujensis TaxID=1128675 RepID=UPI001E521413|nr:carbohydrate ABC transporter permease [Pseudonocardia kujensis]MCE0764859.1 carbohydrate ABC transporter permease [Pseudonocardia kujensis]